MEAASVAQPSVFRRTRHVVDRIGDNALFGLSGAAAALALLIIAAIIWKVADGAWPAIRHFGIAFVWHGAWNPVIGREAYGARNFIIGTLVTSFGALLIAAPLSIAIGLFLSELAPPAIRGPIGSLVEMLAAVPSVVVGLWGILVLGPFMRSNIEPFLHDYFGWIPIFGGPPSQSGVLIAIVVLTMMTIPIASSICRELFLGVPRDLKEAAVGLGATRWEMVRHVVVYNVRGGVVAGIILGLGRALGEAIAVTQVIGNSLGPFHISLFKTGNTLASQIAANYQGASTNLQVASLVYLALILLVITFIANLGAQRIVKRFELQRTGGS
ncbi:MAG: phosphate ABC transporter permease subunit PstC [Actinobacteria bacterium]|nr:phosphate ABC transporter permease subunit PstC [Actinomycetota bacterium]MBV8396073.1 phosphate ABC transporter permease subunit PstC [Actinomycetota bacterium]